MTAGVGPGEADRPPMDGPLTGYFFATATAAGFVA